MYYPDLTLYCYFEDGRDPNTLNIGWLDAQHPFPKKKAMEELLDALFERCLDSDVQTRGFHQCEFCDSPKFGSMNVSRGGREAWLGSAEITVNGKDGKVYAAPNLIYHYVAAHDYDPPEEFKAALMAE